MGVVDPHDNQIWQGRIVVGIIETTHIASFPALPLLAKINLEKLRDRKVWYNLPREQPHAFGWRGRNVDDVDKVGQTAHALFTM